MPTVMTQVVGQRDDRGRRTSSTRGSSAQMNEHHQDQEDDQADQRPLGDLACPSSAPIVVAGDVGLRSTPTVVGDGVGRPVGLGRWSAARSGRGWRSLPAVVTIGCAAPSMPVAGDGVADLVDVVLGDLAGWASRRVYCDAALELDAEVEALEVQPERPRASTITPEMAYQSHLRPTKSIETSPS